jgi:hypothetical protein
MTYSLSIERTGALTDIEKHITGTFCWTYT